MEMYTTACGQYTGDGKETYKTRHSMAYMLVILEMWNISGRVHL